MLIVNVSVVVQVDAQCRILHRYYVQIGWFVPKGTAIKTYVPCVLVVSVVGATKIAVSESSFFKFSVLSLLESVIGSEEVFDMVSFC